MRGPLVVAAALGLSLACAGPPAASPRPPRATAEPARFRLERAPRELGPAIARAEAALKALRDRLAARLAAEVSSAGPGNAIGVCRDEAPAIAAEVTAQTGVEVGRTGARLRSAANAPRPWAAPVVEGSRGLRAADVAPVVVDLGDRVGVLRPIVVTAACLACHGAPERIAPAVRAALAAAYPSDRARGLSEGELSGFFWAEARK